LRLTFLGTGTSFGVPVVGCGCDVCRSTDTRDRRTRSGALIEEGGRTLLVDAPPELRLQLLDADVQRLDAVWLTHPHADHLHGLDDLRIFTVRSGRDLPLHLAHAHVDDVRSRFAYVFDGVEAPVGTSKPRLQLEPFDGVAAVDLPIGRARPVAVPHGELTVYGLRVGSLGYVTDCKRLPEAALEALAGVETLVLSALWWGDPHPTHFNIEEAVAAARVVGARRTYLTHLTHRVAHGGLELRLPPDVRPAYDGLTVDL
jgi:phosphoribosyl 1,2-cyclic phosphate phosphodiesterase